MSEPNHPTRRRPSPIVVLLGVVAAAIALVLAVQVVRAQNGGDSAAAGVFTPDQAARGADVYAAQCLECHGTDLAGGEGDGRTGTPALAGEAFWERWSGESLAALHERIATTMPLDAPGSLDAQAYADVTTYLLAFNGFPAGEEELPADPASMPDLTLRTSTAQAGQAGEGAQQQDGGPQQQDGQQEGGQQPDGEPQQGQDARQQDGEQQQQDGPQQQDGQQQQQDGSRQQDGPQQQDGDQQQSQPQQNRQQQDGQQQDGQQQQDGEGGAAQDGAGETPPPDRGWLEVDARPRNVTINLVPPEGRPFRVTGAQTIRDLQPGWYLVAVSRGHQSHVSEVLVEAGKTARARVVLDELSRSNDVPEEPAVPATGIPSIPDTPEGRPRMVQAQASTMQDGGPQQQDGQQEGGQQPDGEPQQGQDARQQDGEQQQQDGPQQQDGDQQQSQPQQNQQQQDGQQQDGQQQAQQNDQQQDGQGGNGYYSEEQARSGQDVFSQQCASCHGENLGGGTGPALTGDGFLDAWNNAWELFDYTRDNMPLDAPGSLGEDQYLASVAHILAQNGFPSGQELTADQAALEQLPLDPPAASNGDPQQNQQQQDGQRQDGQQQTGQQQEGQQQQEGGQQQQAQQQQDGDPQQQQNGQQRQDGQQQQQESQRQDGQQQAQAGGEQAATQAERGAQAYAQQCSRCHGENLEGNVAPALAGPVFMERWGGHPLYWLYFDAREMMPPYAPGTLPAETYADIMVYVLTENGILEGGESFEPRSEELNSILISTGDSERRRATQERVDRLRDTLHRPHGQGVVPTNRPITPIEEPEATGAAPFDAPGQLDANPGTSTGGH